MYLNSTSRQTRSDESDKADDEMKPRPQRARYASDFRRSAPPCPALEQRPRAPFPRLPHRASAARVVTHSPSSAAHNHPDLALLVETFYGRAREDALLGPVFAAMITDWPHHLRALTGFWAAQLRGRGTYRGHPIAAHRAMAARLKPEMFDRWLALWNTATAEVMGADDAAILQERAARIATVLRAAVFERGR